MSAKKFIIYFSIFFFLFVLIHQKSLILGVGKEYLITQNSIGVVKLGMSPNEVETKVRRWLGKHPDEVGEDVCGNLYYRYYFGEKQNIANILLEISFCKGKAIRISTKWKFFKTSKGIGIGDTIRKASKIYGEKTQNVLQVGNITFFPSEAFYYANIPPVDRPIYEIHVEDIKKSMSCERDCEDDM